MIWSLKLVCGSNCTILQVCLKIELYTPSEMDGCYTKWVTYLTKSLLKVIGIV